MLFGKNQKKRKIQTSFHQQLRRTSRCWLFVEGRTISYVWRRYNEWGMEMKKKNLHFRELNRFMDHIPWIFDSISFSHVNVSVVKVYMLYLQVLVILWERERERERFTSPVAEISLTHMGWSLTYSPVVVVHSWRKKYKKVSNIELNQQC